MARNSTYHRAAEWALTGETGASSKALCARMLDIKDVHGKLILRDHPLDPADLRRCMLLLRRIPAWRNRMHLMLRVSKPWAALARHWRELEASLAKEIGPKLAGGAAPETYKLMRQILAGLE